MYWFYVIIIYNLYGDVAGTVQSTPTYGSKVECVAHARDVAQSLALSDKQLMRVTCDSTGKGAGYVR